MVTSIEAQTINYFEPLSRISGESLRGSARDISLAVQSNSTLDVTADIVDLSRQVFDAIEKGLQDLRQADLNLASQRLRAAQELLDITSALLDGAEQDQQATIFGNIISIGETLNSITSQIEQAFGRPASYGETTLEYSESLSIDVELTLQQSRIVAASLEIESTQTLAVQRSAGPAQLLNIGQQFEAVLSAFQQTIQEFQSVLRNVLENFTREEIQPELPIDLLAEFLGGTLELPQVKTETQSS